MKLTDDFLLENVSQERANAQLAAYISYLIAGNTLICRTLKSASIATYVRDIAYLMIPVRGNDPRYIEPTDRRMAPIIKAQLDQLKQWEGIADKQEPYTLEMLLDHISESSGLPDDELDMALIDHFICALYAGYRCCEWNQSDQSKKKLGSHRADKPPGKDEAIAYALTLMDVRFRNDTSTPYPITKIISQPGYVPGTCLIVFTFQKNGKHGEERKFARNDDKPHLCFVRAMMRIIQRFVRLCGMREDLPMSVYYNPEHREVRNITAEEVEACMQATAVRVYNLDITKEADYALMKKWTSHSLRIGACVLLYTRGFSEMEIKFILRWASDAFRDYLRNLTCTAQKQNMAFNEASTMPNFL